MTLKEAVGGLQGKAVLGDAEALVLRRTIYGSTLTVTREEVEALFRLNAEARELSVAWRQLFIEATTDLIVRQGQPSGYVDEATADWLVGLVRANLIKGDEIELLLHVLEEADGTPARFSYFVLGVVKRFALTTIPRLGRLDARVLSMLRRAVTAKGSTDNVSVTHAEAEALFEVNVALRGLPADPMWKDFFVRAVAGAVLSAPVWRADANAEQQEQSWLADPKQLLVFPWTPRDAYTEQLVEDGEHAMLHPLHEAEQDVGHGNLSHLAHDWADFRHALFDHPMEEREAADEATLADADVLTDDEADWLLARIGAAEPVDDNEVALVEYILANAASATPKLETGLRALQRQAA